MSEFAKKLSLKALASEGYRSASDRLFSSYIFKLIGEKSSLDRSLVKQLITVAQFLYKVDEPKFRKEGAAILSMLIEVCGDDYPEIIGIANKVFSSVGDFPNLKLIERKYPELSFTYHFYSAAEMDFRKELNTVPELDFPLTDFQRMLWADLMAEDDIITVAPTSAGKTHIILSYLVRKLKDSEQAFAAIIVPTRALITEVATKLYEISKEQRFEKDIEICTLPHDKGYGEKTFFVMTQERLFDVLQSGDITFNYLFIDEAHNITDESRGVLLHLTIEKLLEDSLPQVIVSMPSPSYQDSFSTVFEGVEFKKEITSFSPVAKIMMDVKPEGRNLKIKRHNTESEVSVKKGFTGSNFADIVFKLGQGNSNIIYRNQTNFCEDFAQAIADRVIDFEASDELEEAANYVEEFIHNDFTLAQNLRKGVAFHYGPLPSSLRVMIENLVKEDLIKFVACTSTLAEGVNLPAKNLFLKNPIRPIRGKPSERLEDVKINNITGRAGRMLEHFSGNIFVVEPDLWQIDDYFDEEQDQEEKIPTYFKALNEELSSVILALNGQYPHDGGEHYKFYTIANKLIKEISSGKLSRTIDAPELNLNQEDKELLVDDVNRAYKNLQVAPFTLEANPTIGYIQQDKLFKFLNEKNDIKDWTLPHPKSANLYDTLLKVCEKLTLFGVYTPTGDYQLTYICLITKKWLQGDSLKGIISEQIDWLRDNEDKGDVNPNKAVRDVIKVINNDIRFRLSNALRCYQVLLTNVLALKNIHISNTKLHSYIEIGACEDRMIALINMGLSREAAKDINDNLSSVVEIESLNSLIGILGSGLLDRIHPITKKELKAMAK
ncbi:MAG: DEAD/DEAH box helicase [Flavobacteriaceae bacterium]|nr:DEAD/DEAH box helicase [Flavobacteriaceae bacterium]